ncbi:MAG: DUF3592 domain-containing protein [Undibacterium sp.]
MTIEKPPTHLPRKAAENSLAGRLYLGALGLSVAFAGLVFVALMGRSYLRAKEMRTWPSVPCEIIVSDIEQRQHDPNSSREFRQILSYGYEWQGKARTGDHLSLRDNPWTSKPDVIKARAAVYPVGKFTTCLVDPKNPDFSVL